MNRVGRLHLSRLRFLVESSTCRLGSLCYSWAFAGPPDTSRSQSALARATWTGARQSTSSHRNSWMIGLGADPGEDGDEAHEVPILWVGGLIFLHPQGSLPQTHIRFSPLSHIASSDVAGFDTLQILIVSLFFFFPPHVHKWGKEKRKKEQGLLEWLNKGLDDSTHVNRK